MIRAIVLSWVAVGAVIGALYLAVAWPVFGVALVITATLIGVALGMRQARVTRAHHAVVEQECRGALTDAALARVVDHWSQGRS